MSPNIHVPNVSNCNFNYVQFILCQLLKKRCKQYVENFNRKEKNYSDNQDIK